MWGMAMKMVKMAKAMKAAKDARSAGVAGNAGKFGLNEFGNPPDSKWVDPDAVIKGAKVDLFAAPGTKMMAGTNGPAAMGSVPAKASGAAGSKMMGLFSGPAVDRLLGKSENPVPGGEFDEAGTGVGADVADRRNDYLDKLLEGGTAEDDNDGWRMASAAMSGLGAGMAAQMAKEDRDLHPAPMVSSGNEGEMPAMTPVDTSMMMSGMEPRRRLSSQEWLAELLA